MLSMDGTENELVMVVIKNEIKDIFYLSHLIFCNSNSATSSTMHGEMHGGGWVVPSLMVVENGAIGFACMIFSIPAISPWRAQSMDASHSGRQPQHWQKRGWCHISTVMGSKRVKVWWLVWCPVWTLLMVQHLLDAIFYDVW
jgi:hypothetical protein